MRMTLLLVALLGLSACQRTAGTADAVTSLGDAEQACNRQMAGLNMEARAVLSREELPRSGGYIITYQDRSIDGLVCVADEKGVMELGRSGEPVWQRSAPQN